MFIAVAHLTIIFQAINGFDLKEPWDHLQVYFMSLLQLIIASELTRSLAFGIIFVMFLIALVAAMVISHFLKEGTIKGIKLSGPLIAISILTLIITGIFFISTPRARGSIWGKTHIKGIKTVGFSERVDFGSYGEVKLDPTIVMRIEMQEDISQVRKGIYNGTYWRGMTLNYFDGVSWENTLKNRYRINKQGGVFIVTPFPMDKAIIQKIFLEPLDSNVVFGVGNIMGIEIDSRTMFADDALSVFMPEKFLRRLNYTVYSTLEEPLARQYASDYLRFPSGFEKVAGLALEVTKGFNTDMEKALNIENYLKNNYRYSLTTSPSTQGISPIEDFLFNSSQGYCEHYATSMALMLRAVGIPSRIVSGFIGGERNKYGDYIIIRQSNAHSWVEAVINDRWKRFDPTPSAPMPEMPSIFSLYLDSLRMKWYRYVVNFSPSDQKKLIEYISIPLIKIPVMPEIKLYKLKTLFYGLFVIAGIIIIILLLQCFKIQRHGFITASYLKFRDSLKRKGANITISSTPSDVMREALRVGMRKDAEEFIRLYKMARFGGKDLSEEDRKRYKSLFCILILNTQCLNSLPDFFSNYNCAI